MGVKHVGKKQLTKQMDKVTTKNSASRMNSNSIINDYDQTKSNEILVKLSENSKTSKSAHKLLKLVSLEGNRKSAMMISQTTKM